MPQLGLALSIDNTNQLRSYAQLVKSAGGVLYLDARKANGISKGINSPFTNPFVDLTGKGNNVTLTNFAGTTADGYEMKLLPNGKTMPMLNCDGVDSYGILANTPSLDITGTEEFVITAGFLTGSTIPTQTIYYDGGDGSAVANRKIQIYTLPDGTMNFVFEGLVIANTSIGAIQPNTMYDIRIIRMFGRLRVVINAVEIANYSYTVPLTSKPHKRILARTNDASGITHLGYTKGSLAWLSIHRATYGDLSKVDYAIDKIAKDYI